MRAAAFAVSKPQREGVEFTGRSKALEARARRSSVRLSDRRRGSGNARRATAPRGVRLPDEEEALKRRIPRAPLARNKARRARGGVQGAKR